MLEFVLLFFLHSNSIFNGRSLIALQSQITTLNESPSPASPQDYVRLVELRLRNDTLLFSDPIKCRNASFRWIASIEQAIDRSLRSFNRFLSQTHSCTDKRHNLTQSHPIPIVIRTDPIGAIIFINSLLKSIYEWRRRFSFHQKPINL